MRWNWKKRRFDGDEEAECYGSGSFCVKYQVLNNNTNT